MSVGYSSSEEEEEEVEKEEEEKEEEEAAAPKQSCSRKRREEEEEEENGGTARKKHKTERKAPETRLPLPGCSVEMFPEDVDSPPEDSALHGGRVRTFKHERGNWATYVYLPYHPEDEFAELLDELLSVAKARGVVLNPQEEFHLSSSQTVVSRHHWIQPFTQSLKAGSVHCRRFVCTAGRSKVYCNAERTRTFSGMEVCTGHAQLSHSVQAVDRTMTEFRSDTFYEDPSFHVSSAWCVGNMTGQMKECLQESQDVVDDHEEGSFVLRLDCEESRCRTGNKTFRFPSE